MPLACSPLYFLFLFLHSLLIAGEYKLPSAMPIIKLSKNKAYHIDKGWNYLLTPKEGLDIIAMLENIDSIKKIYLTDKNSKIKQVASGRFGVTANYLVNSEEIQIKIAQIN